MIKRLKHQWPKMRHIADIQGNQKPNAKLTGARLAVPKRCLVSASLLNAKLGWCKKHWRMSPNGPCIAD